MILDNYPVASILRISSGLFSIGPWDKKRLTIEDESVSLSDIEHQTLRPIWRDPRIHYVINCASIGCPNLLPDAFTATNTEDFLEQNARAYINHERGVSFKGERLVVSKIYTWFREDFGTTDANIIQHLSEYAESALVEKLSRTQCFADDDYDWDLNEVDG